MARKAEIVWDNGSFRAVLITQHGYDPKVMLQEKACNCMDESYWQDHGSPTNLEYAVITECLWRQLENDRARVAAAGCEDSKPEAVSPGGDPLLAED